jgi:hypothetical protein
MVVRYAKRTPDISKYSRIAILFLIVKHFFVVNLRLERKSILATFNPTRSDKFQRLASHIIMTLLE